jgi:hypothetical protein
MNTETFIGNVKEEIQKNTKGEKYLKKIQNIVINSV